MAVESYGFDVYRDLLTSAGLRTPPIYVDESGARIDDGQVWLNLAGHDGLVLRAAL